MSVENVKYVTLSYVWGSANEDDQSGGDPSPDPLSLPSILPRTIEDTITVTLKLGYRYLWVDKYCIDQSNPQQFKEEIKRMDLIYRDSVLTIVDATGADPHGGLPGVRQGSRSPYQPSITLKGIELVSTMRRPEWDIKISPWNTRAWTYQESLLSLKKLVFTPEQLYFQCRAGMYCKE
ncbi:heterokaryon incompatibility, partial [Polyplosphaeria fusca]